jgi:peptidoglycan/xylan/chitin deacetylase (PgdA/CDA1 family)
VKRKLKRLTLRSCKALGVFNLAYGSDWRRNRLLILAYHGISQKDEHLWDPQLYMSPECFAARMEVLKRSGCNVLRLDEAIERLYAGDLPEKSVAITFDDGAHDFYSRAYPILKSYGFPATVYLTTYYSAHNRPVFNVIIRYAMWKGRDASVDGAEFTGQAGPLDLSTRESRNAIAEAMIARAQREGLSGEEKDRLAQLLAERLGVDYEGILADRILHLMRPEEVAELAAEGVDIQLHTHRHRVPLDRALFLREIEDNRREIAQVTDAPASHFCYPDGTSHRDFLAWLREAGVVSATTCAPGLASHESDRLLLPRFVDTSANTDVEFEAWLSGAYAMLRSTPGIRSWKGGLESLKWVWPAHMAVYFSSML